MSSNIFINIFACQTIAIACGYVLDLDYRGSYWLAVLSDTPYRKLIYMVKYIIKR